MSCLDYATLMASFLAKPLQMDRLPEGQTDEQKDIATPIGLPNQKVGRPKRKFKML